MKTLTAVLLEGAYPHRVLAFGKNAVARFIKESQSNEDSDDDGDGVVVASRRRPTSGVPNLLFQHFKYELCKNRGFKSVDEPVATAQGGEKLPLMTVMAAVLGHFREDALAHLASHIEVNPTVEDVSWVLTIPAIYDDFAKRFMRVAAFEAGIISAVDDASQLQLCLEPEAACLAVSIKDAPLLAQVGDKIMILDCGGGTVDITTHYVKSRSPSLMLEELRKATGGEWGSMCIDNLFKVWFRKFVGSDAYDSVCHISAFYTLLDEWEEGKTNFQGGEDDSISLNLVEVLVHLGYHKRKLKVRVPSCRSPIVFSEGRCQGRARGKHRSTCLLSAESVSSCIAHSFSPACAFGPNGTDNLPKTPSHFFSRKGLKQPLLIVKSPYPAHRESALLEAIMSSMLNHYRAIKNVGRE